MRVLAGQNPSFENTLIHQLFQVCCDVFEMVAHLVFNTALGVAALIAGETVAPSSTRQGMEQVFSFRQFSQTQIKDAGTMSVHQNDGEKRRSTQQVRHRFQMKMTVDK